MPRRLRTTAMCICNPRCRRRLERKCSTAAERPAEWAAVQAGSGATAGADLPATPADTHRIYELLRLEHVVMNASTRAVGSSAATALLVIGVAIGGTGSAAAQPGDYSTLPVDPNLITDSLAYNPRPQL